MPCSTLNNSLLAMWLSSIGYLIRNFWGAWCSIRSDQISNHKLPGVVYIWAARIQQMPSGPRKSILTCGILQSNRGAAISKGVWRSRFGHMETHVMYAEGSIWRKPVQGPILQAQELKHVQSSLISTANPVAILPCTRSMGHGLAKIENWSQP